MQNDVQLSAVPGDSNSLFSDSDRVLLTTQKIRYFSEGKLPKLGDRIV